jgi:N-acetylmuramoyl-L-alanine amidase
VREKDVALTWSLELATELRARGADVLLTREDDRYVFLTERARLANRWGADVFVSMHANAAVNPAANGAWLLHCDGSTRGEEIARRLFQNAGCLPGWLDADPAEEVYPDASGWTDNRRLTVLRETRMPAVLVELGFLTHAGDLEELTSPCFRRVGCLLLAQALGVA